MILDAKDFSKHGSTYVAEVSGLQLERVPRFLTLQNCPKDGQHRSFRCVHVDESGGDIAGWNFEEEDGPNRGRSWEHGHPPNKVDVLKVLLIND